MSTPVQNEIIKTKEESQARTSHAIRQEMIVYREMILNYVWIQTNWQWTVIWISFNKLGSLFQTAGAAWQKARLANAVLGVVLHRIRWDEGRNCLIGWFTRINDDRYPGRCVVNTLRVSSATLYVIWALIGKPVQSGQNWSDPIELPCTHHGTSERVLKSLKFINVRFWRAIEEAVAVIDTSAH